MKQISAIILMALTLMLLPVTAAARKTITYNNPKMTVFLPDKEKATGRAIVMLPGGSYHHHAVENEGTAFAPFLNDMGIAAIVVEYTFPKGNRELPMNDVKRAIRMVRNNAKEWNIDPAQVGIMGFSAGGHLASTIATHTSGVEKPDFQILFYPVISMQPDVTHRQSCANFLGENPSQELRDEFSNDMQVTKDTPRTLILSCEDDDIVPIENTTRYYKACHKAGIPVSMHIWPAGGHGWGMNPKFAYHTDMLNELGQWLGSF